MASPRVGRVIVRASAVTQREQRTLLHRSKGDDFWALPGGGVEPGEWAAEAAIREMMEETGAKAVTVERLLWIAENRFAYRGENLHEVNFVFLVTLGAKESAVRDGEFAGAESGTQLLWVKHSNLETLDFRPAFFRNKLDALPQAPSHIQMQGV